MPRTRDLFLVGVIVLFLLSAIGLTWWQQLPVQVHDAATAWLGVVDIDAPEVSASTTVVIVNELADNRPSRLVAMRERVASQLGTELAVPDTAPIATDVTDASADTEQANVDDAISTGGVVSGVQRCSSFVSAVIPWSPQGILFQESEGVRVVFREVAESATDATAPASRTVLAQLPLRQFPLPTTQCLPTDVIGIAQDGSLIRNNELALYGIFGAQTVIGYALDGFPIHGANPGAPVDACGGMVVDGQYRYYLDGAREGLINCFAGIPATL